MTEVDCDACDGRGRIPDPAGYGNYIDCQVCGGSGKVKVPDEEED